MNLQNLNLVELNAQEVQEVDGGGWIADLEQAVIDLDKNWDNLKKRFMNGYNSYGNCGC
ncbi:hypothetical protein [Flavobacterium glaciei]|nr:hypothetical protein [Flavobacterium glaciei]